MSERDKLIELFCEAKKTDPESAPFSEFLADYLISNGVTFQQWIPVTERLPDKELWEYMKKYNQDNMEVLVMIKGAKEATTLYYDDDGDFCDDEGNAWLVTHWMPLPEPVKED